MWKKRRFGVVFFIIVVHIIVEVMSLLCTVSVECMHIVGE